MFKIFKKKKPEDLKTFKKTVEIKDFEQDNITNYIFEIDVLPEDLQNRRVSIENWDRFDGDKVSKGEIVGKLVIENEYGKSISLKTDVDGAIEIFKLASKSILNPDFIKEKEKLFCIHKDPDDQKILELKNKKFENIPIINTDEFSGLKEIKWESVAGSHIAYSHSIDIIDSIILFSDDNNYNKLMFTFNNIDNKDYIVFKYPTKNFKLTLGSKISFLFNNDEVLYFVVTNKPFKSYEHYNWGHIYETRVQLTTQELDTFKTQTLYKWKIEFAKTIKKITGIIDSSDIQFCINKLANDYYDLVKTEIVDYQPLADKQEKTIDNTISSEECYLYLMIDITNNYYKIGISNNPEYREKTLQSEKPTIEMICYKRFPNRKIATSFEQALHQSYVNKRIRGEWFNLTEKEVRELKETLIS